MQSDSRAPSPTARVCFAKRKGSLAQWSLLGGGMQQVPPTPRVAGRQPEAVRAYSEVSPTVSRDPVQGCMRDRSLCALNLGAGPVEPPPPKKGGLLPSRHACVPPPKEWVRVRGCPCHRSEAAILGRTSPGSEPRRLPCSLLPSRRTGSCTRLLTLRSYVCTVAAPGCDPRHPFLGVSATKKQ